MKLEKIYLALLWVTALGAIPAFAGNISGGGDPRRFYFEDGQKQAARVLEEIDARSFDTAIDPEVRDWILRERGRLVSDLNKTILIWLEDPNSQDTCARTEYAEAAIINLSFGKCNVISSKEEAGKLLVHETVHHLGIRDELFADRVAMAAYAAWENKMLTSIPMCDPDSGGDSNDPRGNMIAPRLEGEWIPDPALTKRLVGEGYGIGLLSFKKDLSVLDRLPGFGGCAVTAGVMRIVVPRHKEDRTYQFVLTMRRGSPIIRYYREVTNPEGKQFNLEWFYVTLTRAKNTKDDILFMGGDTLQESFTAFGRK